MAWSWVCTITWRAPSNAYGCAKTHDRNVIDNACGDTGHPLVVKQKMNDFRRPWNDFGGSWNILEGRFGRSWLILVVDFG